MWKLLEVATYMLNPSGKPQIETDMKKISYIIFAAASIVLAACSKEVAIDNKEKAIEAPETTVNEELVTYSFTAGEAEMKSSLTNGGVFSWAENDKIAIYNSTTSSFVEFYVESVDGSGNATIKADAAPGAVWTNAIYPAARATGAENEVDYTVTSVSGPILVSEVDGQNLSFKYLGAVANIQVDGVPGTPATLTFTANTNVFGSRTFSWSGGEPVLSGSGTQASITVPFTTGIISVPIPQASYAGFTITVDHSAGRHLYKKTTGNTFDMSAKKLLPMPALSYVEPGYYVKTSSASGYWDTDAARMIKTGANSYVLSENCDGDTTYYIYDEYNSESPTTAYLATGLAKSTFATGVSAWGLVGTGFDDSTWDQKNPVAMQYEGDWQFVKNIKFTQTWPQIKFVIGGSWDNAHGASVTHSDASTSNNVIVGNYGEISSQGNSVGNIYVENVTPNEHYDIFLNPTTHEVRVFLSSASHDPNEASGIWQFEYNSSTGVATHTWKSAVKDNPFGDAAYPKAGLGIKGSWNDWAAPYTAGTSYNNQSWVISNFAPGNSGSFSFGLCDSSSNNWTDLSTDSTFATVNPEANLYGTLTYWRNGAHANPSVTLENATYTVYVNVNPNIDGGVNLMFVKN